MRVPGRLAVALGGWEREKSERSLRCRHPVSFAIPLLPAGSERPQNGTPAREGGPRAPEA